MRSYLVQNGTLYESCQVGTTWCIQSGILKLMRPSPRGLELVQLALPGDIVGAETLCGEAYTHTAVALQNCTLTQPDVAGDFQRFSIVAQGYLQQQQRMQDMVKLRTGTVASRVAHMLRLFRCRADGTLTEIAREDLPTFKEMAALLDIAPETICRELNYFLPKRSGNRHAFSQALVGVI